MFAFARDGGIVRGHTPTAERKQTNRTTAPFLPQS